MLRQIPPPPVTPCSTLPGGDYYLVVPGANFTSDMSDMGKPPPTCDHLAPELVVFQRPPVSLATMATALLAGLTSTATARPPLGIFGLKSETAELTGIRGRLKGLMAPDRTFGLTVMLAACSGSFLFPSSSSFFLFFYAFSDWNIDSRGSGQQGAVRGSLCGSHYVKGVEWHFYCEVGGECPLILHSGVGDRLVGNEFVTNGNGDRRAFLCGAEVAPKGSHSRVMLGNVRSSLGVMITR